MTVLVECPACEEQFPVDEKQSAEQINCPSCDKEFMPSGSVTRRTEELGFRPSTTFSGSILDTVTPPTSRSKEEESSASSATSKSSNSPPPVKTNEQSNSVDVFSSIGPKLGKSADPLNEPSDLLDSTEVARDEDRPIARVSRRSRTAPWVVGLMALIGVIAIFGVLYVAVDLLNKTNRENLTNSDDSIPRLADANTTDSEAGKTDAIQNAGQTNAEQPGSSAKALSAERESNKPVTKPKPEEYPTTLSVNDFRKVWRRVNSYLVKLDVTTPWGLKQSTGFIIDSRGWVATSLSALNQASAVKVTLAARELDQGIAWRNQSDDSFGVIATDPQHDLAIIAINRDLVLNFTDMEFIRDARIVGSQRLIAARTPPAEHRLWLKEIRVDSRGGFGSLDSVTQKLIRDTQMDQSPLLLWIVHSIAPTAGNQGAPLFDKDGKCVAMNIGLKSGRPNEGFAVPIQYLLDLKNKSTNDPVPFGQISTPVGDSLTQPSDAFKSSVQSEFEEIKQLEISGETCAEFQFVARQDDEFESLKLFCERLGKAVDLAQNVSLDFDEREIVSEQLEKISNEVGKSFESFPIQETARVRNLNQTMLNEATGSTPLVLIGQVENNPALGKRYKGQACAVFSISGSDQSVFVVVNDNTPVFSQGDRWMVAGYLRPNDILRLDEGESATQLRFLGAWSSD